jgi:flagellar biosynthesis protein FlhG
MSKRRNRPKAIWAVGGGKGGTGKTFLTSNMGIYLAKLGQSVLLVDADLGGANLHTCLGLPSGHSGLADFFSGGQKDITDYVEETGVGNLYLLSGPGFSWVLSYCQGFGKAQICAEACERRLRYPGRRFGYISRSHGTVSHRRIGYLCHHSRANIY